jgi:hypothetical protein
VHRRGADALATALVRSSHNPAVESLTARLAAGQIMSTQQLLAEDNFRHLAEGRSADVRFPVAVAAAEHGFALLGGGLAAHVGKTRIVRERSARHRRGSAAVPG